MKCTMTYGLSRNMKHEVELPVAEAFRILAHLYEPENRKYAGYAFYNVYLNHRLVYTTQGVAGSRYICTDCPYFELKNGTWMRRKAK